MGRLPALTIPMSMPALMAWYRNALCMASLCRAHTQQKTNELKKKINNKMQAKKRKRMAVPERVVATEGEGQVGYTAADLGMGQTLLDQLDDLDEVHRVVVVLLCHLS